MPKSKKTQRSVRPGRTTEATGGKMAQLQALVHELQTHKIELDQQNEDLREAQDRLVEARNMYADLYEFAPAGYLTLDENGFIHECNLAGASLLGTVRSQLSRRKLEWYVDQSSKRKYRNFLASSYASGSSQTCEIKIHTESKATLDVALKGRRSSSSSSSSSSRQKLYRFVLVAITDITPYMNSQRELRKNREQVGLLIQTVKDYAIFMLDGLGYVSSWNLGAERIKGYTEAEIIGRHFSCFYLGVDIARGKPAGLLEQAARTGQVIDQGWRVRKDGRRFWADVVITALRDESGTVRAYSKVVRDVTERRQMEEALRESKDRLQATLENSPAVISLKDIQGRYLLVNRQFELAFEVKRKQVEGKTDSDIFPPEQASVAQASDGKTLRACAPLEFEEVMLQPDGPHTFIVSKFPLFDPNGMVSAICSMGIDITERTKAVSALKQSDRRTRLILDNAYDAFVAIDEHGMITAWNAQAEKIFGWRLDEALGMKMVDTIIPPQYREAHRRGFRHFLETGEGPMLNRRLEITALRRDGTEFPVELSICPLKIGESYTFNAFISDISERIRWVDDLKRSHEQLLELAARMESVREEERTRMAHEIHDELGQALTGLKLDMAYIKQQLSEGHPSLTHKLDDMVKLADDTVQSVRDIATQLRPVILDQVGLLPALEWCAKEFENRTRIQCRLNFLLRHVELDHDRSTAVFRIFQEILTNVARHAQATHLDITARESTGRLLLEVVDDGRGIPKAAVDNAHSFGLLGMRHRAMLFNGKIEIMGTPGKGTKVTVTMPLGDHEEKSPLDEGINVKVKRERSQ